MSPRPDDPPDERVWSSRQGTALTDPVAKSDPKTKRQGSVTRAAGLLLTVLPLAVVSGAVMGLGLLRGAPAGLALLAGLALAILPAAGLTRLTSSSGRLSAWCSWGWCLALLAGLPLYFPGERQAGTSAGLERLSAFMGSDASRLIGELGADAVSLLGEDPAPLPAKTPGLEAKPAARVELAREQEIPPPLPREEQDTDPARVELSYRGDQNALRIEVEVDGPEIGEAFTMVFDTGATFTTLDSTSLRTIGIGVEPDSPRVTLQTANGAIEADLVLVDAIWLGEAPVEWVTVAVCDSCVQEQAVGLLGLNVSQRFQVSLDHERKIIDLERRTSGDDRSLDIRNWLRVRSNARENWDGSVEAELTAFNYSRREIRAAVLDLECGDAAFAIQLENVPRHGQSTARADLPRGTDCREQRLELSRAYWSLDRFEP